VLAWKWSETTGKFIGCPFWSLSAKTVFDHEIALLHDPSLEDAWKLSQSLGQKIRKIDQQLTHEHVFPKRFFCEILRNYQPTGIQDINALRALFSRLAIGCVVLESEHPPHAPNAWANRDNPWRRYQGITLVENPAWPEEHKLLIARAGLQIVPS
jgi:hypothetical protein